MKELILGGVRSGKSRLAEAHARDSGLEIIYIATAQYSDDVEMRRRIAEHRRRRPAQWQTIEEPMALAKTLRLNAGVQRCVLVECLTLWLTNLLCTEDPLRLQQERDALLAVVPQLPGQVVFVSNECGSGIAPLGELARRFVDEAGLLHQRLAAACDRVILTVAGLPLSIKT